MKSNEKLKELKELIEQAQNPIIFYDNDADGLCSYVLLRRFLGRGKGVAIRSYPDLSKEYARRVFELKGDYAIILDKPLVSKEFVDEMEKKNIPVIWIDHHDMDVKMDNKNLTIFNLAKEGKSEPVSYIIYNLTNKKEDAWIALMGCISDHYLPDFASNFAKEYPDLWNKDVRAPFDAYFNTGIGRIALALNFGLMDSTTHIVQLQNYLINCQTPTDVLAEMKENKQFRENYERINKKYLSLVEKASENVEGKMIFFEYAGDLSVSSEIANEIYYKNKNKYVVVAYKKQGVCNLSLRGKNIRELLQNVLKSFKNASGGGHNDAVGARVMIEDLPRFKELMIKEIEDKK